MMGSSMPKTEYDLKHYDDVIMGAIAPQITSLTIVHSTVYSDADQRKHQSSATLAFLRGIHRTNGQLRGKKFPFDNVIMRPLCILFLHRVDIIINVDNRQWPMFMAHTIDCAVSVEIDSSQPGVQLNNDDRV